MELTSIITLVAYLVLALSLAIGFLFGLKRGLVRSSIRLGTFLVFVVIAGLITMPISNSIANIDISGIGWEVNGEVVSNLPDGITALLLQNEQISQAAAEMPSVLSLIESLPAAIISIVVFILLVLVMSFLSWIVYVIIEKFALKQSRLERKAKKQIKQDKKNLKGQIAKPSSVQVIVPKENRRRWLGSAVGLVFGFLFIFCLFVPISSLTSTISEIASSPSSPSVNAEQGGEFLTETSSDLLKYYLGEETISYVDAFSQSVPGKMLTLGGFDDVIFDALTSVSVNSEKFAFRKDVLTLTKVYDEYVFLVDEIGASENYKNVDFDKIERLLNQVLDMGIVRALAEEAVPYALTLVYDSEGFVNFEYNQEVKTALDNVVESLKSSKSGFVNTLKSDLSSVLKICQSACQVGLVDSWVGGERDLSTLVSSLSVEDYKLINSLTENLTSSYTLRCILTGGLNVAFEVVQDQTNDELYLGDLDQNKIDWALANSSLNSLLRNAVDGYLILDRNGIDQNNIENLFSEKFSTEDFNALISLVGSELELLKSSPLFVSQEINAYNQLVDYVILQEPFNELLDAPLLKSLNWEDEINQIKPSLTVLKEQGILDYAINNELDITEICTLLINEESLDNRTYVREVLKPLLDSRLSQKPIKYALELANENMDTLREKIGQEVVDIDLSNFTYLSAADKEEIINLLDGFVVMVVDFGFESFADDTLSTILSLNDQSLSGGVNSDYIVNIINPLSKISILRPTYNSIFQAAQNNEEFNQYLTLGEAASEDFSWEEEFEIINVLLSIFEKENNGESVVNMLFPTGDIGSVEITNELISKIFNNLKLPLYETLPQSSSIRVMINNLYDSKILKQTLVYLINTLNESVGEQISSEENVVSISPIGLDRLTEDQEEDIVVILERLADCFDILTGENFDLGNMTDEEIEKVGSFLNSLKENAYDYSNSSPNPDCVLSSDGKTVENGGIFAELYIAMIDYAKQSYSFSGNVSYGEIEWINFLKTAQKLSSLSSGGNILDILADPESGVDVGDALEVVGASEDTSNKISDIQNSFVNVDSSSSQSFEDLSNSLGNITEENASEIVDIVQSAIGEDISSSVDLSYIQKEQAVSSRISLLMTTGITSENLEESLSDLCNGATLVLQRAVASGVTISSSLSTEKLSASIDSKTTDETVRNLVKALF